MCGHVVQAIAASVGALPGVDVNDPQVAQAIADAAKAAEEGGDADKPDDKPDQA